MTNDQIKQWQQDYEFHRSRPPKAGEYLKTKDGTPVKLQIICEEGREPFVFTRAKLELQVGAPLIWYAQSKDDKISHGWKCILQSASKAEVIKRSKLTSDHFYVQELIVKRYSKDGKSILCEVSQW
jgi:hypothetical protein